MTANNIVPFTQSAVPAVSFGDMTRLAEAVAKSGMFGIKTTDQALALMALAQAEGQHPATVARDYHVINGSPAKKAEAMQRDFLMSGGKIEWHELTDDAVEATFSHPIGGTATIRWDTARCKQAGLTSGNHAKFPRQMKRSRVVSEGVRTVWPLATSGFYVPEEVAEFARTPDAANTRSELDRFAAANPAEIIDAETGEVLDAAQIERDARQAAARGTESFRGYLLRIGRDARAILNGKVGTRDAPGELLTLAMSADQAGQDPHPIPPAGTNQPTTSGKDAVGGSGRLHAATLNPTTPAGGTTMPDLLDGKARQATGEELQKYHVPLSRVPSDNEQTRWDDKISALLADGVAPALIREANTQNIENLRICDPAYYVEIMKKLGAG